MPRLFLDERNLQAAGISQQNINTIRELADFLNLAREVAETQEGLTEAEADIEAAEAALGLKQPLDGDLTALSNNSTNGFWARTGSGTGAARTITGTANEIDVANGAGTAGNPTLSLPAAITLTGKTMTGGTFNGGTYDVGSMRVDSFRLDQTPTAETITPTHTMTISLDGTNYKVALQAA